MKKHDIDIQIGQYGFPYVTEVVTESSWEKLTDTAEISLPRKLSMDGQSIAQGESLFRRGDAVSVRLGYDGQYDEVFQGYVAGITPGVPMRFRCEDAMWKLKQEPVTQSWRSATLRQVLTDIVPIPFETVDAELGPFRVTRATPAQVLEELRKTYALQSWVRSGTLYCGLAYWPGMGTSHTFRFGIHTDDARSDLEYSRADDVRLRVRAISIEPDNRRIEVELGDPDGELRTLNYVSLGSEKALREIATRELERLRYEGYRGSFTTFGQPHVQHGDLVTLQDPRYPDRTGTYYVKTVKTSGGRGGYRQQIALDAKA